MVQKKNPSIQDCIFPDQIACTKQRNDLRHKDKAQKSDDGCPEKNKFYEHGKDFICFFRIFQTKIKGYQCTATCSDHKSQRRNTHQDRHDQIYCCKCILAGII